MAGHAKVVADVLRDCGVRIGGLFDDQPGLDIRADWDVLPGLYLSGPEAFQVPNDDVIVTIGNNKTRLELAKKLERLKVHFASAIHPSASVSDSAVVGDGSVVFHHAVVQAGTVVGNHVIINTSASVDHDCRLGDAVHISPNATLCGGVGVGEGTLIGAGATLLRGIQIGKGCVIGAGATVIRDVPDGTTAVGCPTRPIKLAKITKPKSTHGGDFLLSVINKIHQGAGRAELERLTPDQRLQQDLQLDSLELAELTVRLEAKFGVDVFESSIPETVGDILSRLPSS